MVTDAQLQQTSEELTAQIESYWEQYVRNEPAPTYPGSVVSLMNNFALVGMIGGMSVGAMQQITNAFNIVSKTEGFPFFEGIPPIYQTKVQSLGRVFVSGAKGGSLAAFYSGSYFLGRSFNVDNSVNLFMSGFTAGTMGGYLC